jgi:hypothetical protein
MALDTLVDVDLAITKAVAMPMNPPSKYRIRAGILADLYEVQAQLFEAAQREASDQIPGIYVAACGHAAVKARSTAGLFRREAESRRVKRARRS